jgi:hypothetical protein
VVSVASGISNAKRLTLGGVLIALTLIVLYAESVLPTSKLSLYVISSFFVSVIVIESGIRTAWIFYIASSLMALIIIPDKIAMIPYVVFFGVYGIIKFYIERLGKLIAEYILKFGYFNLCLLIAVLLIKEFFLDSLGVSFPLWIVIVGLEAVFLVYDYVYTLFIQYYNRKIRTVLKL